MLFQTIVFIVAFFMLALIGYLLFGNAMNPATIMCGVWAVILFAYSFRAYNLFEASELSLFLIFTGITMFFAGCVSVYVRRRHDLSLPVDENKPIHEPDYKVLIVLNVISIICFLGFFVSTIKLLWNGYGFDYIARYFADEEGTVGSSGIGYKLTEWIVWPINMATSPIAAIAFLADTKKSATKKWFIITFLINLAMFVIVTGKRINLLLILVYMIILFVLHKQTIKLKRRTKILIAAGIVIILSAFYIITVSRGSSLFRTIYIYLCGCVPCFSRKLENIPVGYQYGLVSFHGFYRAPFILLGQLVRSSTFQDVRSMFADVVAYTQERLRIGTSVNYNAFVTPFFYFYTDLGTLGVVVFSFFFGVFSAHHYVEYVKSRSYYRLAVYLLLTYSLFMSMVRFQFVQMRYVLGFFFLLLAFTRDFPSRFRILRE